MRENTVQFDVVLERSCIERTSALNRDGFATLL